MPRSRAPEPASWGITHLGFGAWQRQTGARPTPGSRSSRSTPRTTSPASTSSCRARSRTRAARTRRCTAAGRGRSGSTPGFGSAEETNARFRYLLERGQTGLSTAFDLPTQLGYDSDDPRAAGEVGRTGVAIDSLADMELLFDWDPARRGLDVDDDQRAGGAPPAPLRARRRGAGRKQRPAARHRSERHPQGVRRARELHLPAAARRCG